ncbi:DDE-type integrase/transposase/recombinase [Georgenia yuyongxinii]|uniref:DDE-type integrase/transposase/recombinase n=1 Tax=Georgenia yuyongxinii TaxID=2589797 RepID=A0A5B8BZI7_9MICO|nr:DDE-type integrase/transposase/recombinase [Georgenia yuyongxinii]QDC23839.1 DDE-type integrase/transposase/recombinase [Georgenia yuyongxinii]
MSTASTGSSGPARSAPRCRQGQKRAGDKLNRDFTAPAPNLAWVADFTYVRTWAGFVYVTFAVDLFSQAIVGWHAMTTKHTDLVLTAVTTATWRRDRDGHPINAGLIHHSDAGSLLRFNGSMQHRLDRLIVGARP